MTFQEFLSNFSSRVRWNVVDIDLSPKVGNIWFGLVWFSFYVRVSTMMAIGYSRTATDLSQHRRTEPGSQCPVITSGHWPPIQVLTEVDVHWLRWACHWAIYLLSHCTNCTSSCFESTVITYQRPRRQPDLKVGRVYHKIIRARLHTLGLPSKTPHSPFETVCSSSHW